MNTTTGLGEWLEIVADVPRSGKSHCSSYNLESASVLSSLRIYKPFAESKFARCPSVGLHWDGL